jgi:hypothetical protein
MCVRSSATHVRSCLFDPVFLFAIFFCADQAKICSRGTGNTYTLCRPLDQHDDPMHDTTHIQLDTNDHGSSTPHTLTIIYAHKLLYPYRLQLRRRHPLSSAKHRRRITITTRHTSRSSQRAVVRYASWKQKHFLNKNFTKLDTDEDDEHSERRHSLTANDDTVTSINEYDNGPQKNGLHDTKSTVHYKDDHVFIWEL